jgi:hypothetical protein
MTFLDWLYQWNDSLLNNGLGYKPQITQAFPAISRFNANNLSKISSSDKSPGQP